MASAAKGKGSFYELPHKFDLRSGYWTPLVPKAGRVPRHVCRGDPTDSERGARQISLWLYALIRVTALVDWTNQIHGLATRIEDPLQLAERALDRTVRVISRLLLGEITHERYQVSLRLYHGWHKGFEATVNFKAIRNVISKTDFAISSRNPSVVILQEVQYGYLLFDALPERLHGGLTIHLPNTLRQRHRRSKPEEKMVDTALAADLLTLARTSPAGWVVVLGDDDDLVPPVFVAEAWMRPFGGRVLLARSRRTPFLRLEGLFREVTA